MPVRIHSFALFKDDGAGSELADLKQVVESILLRGGKGVAVWHVVHDELEEVVVFFNH